MLVLESKALLTHSAFIPGIFAGWTGSIKLNTADATDIVLWHVPAPCRDGIPLLDRDLHNLTRRNILRRRDEAIIQNDVAFLLGERGFREKRIGFVLSAGSVELGESFGRSFWWLWRKFGQR